MVPVFDTQNKPLMPCTEKIARKLLEKKRLFAFGRGVFSVSGCFVNHQQEIFRTLSLALTLVVKESVGKMNNAPKSTIA